MTPLTMNIRTKLTLAFLAFGILPLIAVMPVVFNKLGDMQQSNLDSMRTTASVVGQMIDRNLYERYGDVQAFGTNSASKDTKNWYTGGSENNLITAMNAYMTNYTLYKLMVLVDTEGKVAAVNTVDSQGKPISTSALYS